MNNFLFELIGTAFLLLLGTGVVANVVLHKTKGHNSGWIVIAFGWAIAVFVGVYVAAAKSGAHLNPAITIALAILEKFDWALVPAQIAGQLLGAMLGSSLAWITYKDHFAETKDAALILAVFATGPAIRNTVSNLLTEIMGTFALVFGVLFITGADAGLHSIDALPVALLVLGIGLGLGGPTGYAINPARDIGPRMMHAILPIKNKGGSDWAYSWIPVVGPLIGGVLAALVFKLL